jgi:LmbE family N-acetylglucosaminyl deacetylase
MNFKEDIKNFFLKINLPEITHIGNRILIIVPHPDDETIATGGIIQKAIKSNIPVKVVITTSGENYRKSAMLFFKKTRLKKEEYCEFGLIRQSESLNALKLMGLSEKDIIFLGFSDGTLRYLWCENWDKNFPKLSPTTKSTSVFYERAYLKGIPYSGEALVEVLEKIIREFNPTDIYYPIAEDMHPDHWACHNFVKYTLLSLRLDVKEHMFLVHHPEWPVPWGSNKNKPLLPPSNLIENINWNSINLEEDEIIKKYYAVKTYKTQIEIMEPFLTAFVRKTELFGEKSPISIPKLSYEPDLEQYLLSHSIFGVYSGGVLEEEIYKSADLTKFTIFYYTDTLYIGIQSAKPISKKVLYRFQMRIFYKDDTIRRVDIGIINDKLHTYNFAKNSLNDLAIEMRTYKKQIWVLIKLPKDEIKHIFMGVDSIYKNRFIDKIPWNVYTF